MIIIYDVGNHDNDINNMTVMVVMMVMVKIRLSTASLFSLSLEISPGTPNSGTPFHKHPILFPYFKEFWNGSGWE